jgi:hypothetical protein
MNSLLDVLREYGPWGLILVVVVYLLLKGQITFRYPRTERKAKK